MEKKKKIPWGLLYVGLTVVVLIVFGLVNHEFLGMFSVVAGLSMGFVLMAVLLNGLYLLLEGEIIRMLLRCQGERISVWSAFRIGLIGIYYSYITPSSTGGQPAQVLYLRRDKVPAGSSAAVLFVKFFAYQFSFVLCACAALACLWPQLTADDPNLIPFIIVGIAINGLWIIVIPLLFCPPVLHALAGWLTRIVGRCRFLKKRESYIGKIRGFEDDFTDYTRKFRRKYRYIAISILLSLPQVVLQFSVLYFVFLAFSVEMPYSELLCMQLLLQVSVCFVPLPGASGAQELGFSAFFGGYFSDDAVLYTALLVWRFFTYYLIVILGALVVVFDQLVFDRRHKAAGNGKKPDDREF